MNAITIIDRYPIVRTGLDVFLKNHFKAASVIGLDSFYPFDRVLLSNSPELLIVGHTDELPSDECKLIAQLKRKNPDTKVIIYDENPDYLKVSLYFKSGVTGYLTKQADMEELLKCISDVQNNKIYISNEIMDLLLPKWNSVDSNAPLVNNVSLTYREFEIASLLISGDTVLDISKKLQRQVSTIRSIKKNLFEKLKITSLVDLKDSLQKSMNKYTH